MLWHDPRVSKVYTDPGPLKDGATPAEREKWRRDNEMFMTGGFKKLPPRGEVAKVDPTDKRLRELRSEHHRFLDMHSPMKASLWLALLLPAKDVIHKAEMSRRFRMAQQGQDAGDFIAPDQPSIIEIGNQLVAAALGGDVTAIDRIADRIEGKAGLRVGDEAEDNPDKRRQAQEITERVIRNLTKGRLDAAGDDAKVVDVEAVTVETPSEQ